MASHAIVLSGDPVYPKERLAFGAITPGDLIRVRAAASTVEVHGTAGGDARPMFAVEDPQHQAGSTEAIAIPYSAADSVAFCIARTGDLIYAWVAANASAVADGVPLESDGAGGLRVFTPQAVNEAGVATFTNYTGRIVAWADEAVDNSGGGTRARIRVRAA